MGFSIRALGRTIDPTSSTSPLGGVARQAIAKVPGGSAALDAVNAGKAMLPKGGQAPGGAEVLNVPSEQPGLVARFKALSTVMKVVIVGGVAVVVYLVVRMFR